MSARARRAAIVSPDPANPAGGVERMCTLLAGVLEREGWTARVVGPVRHTSRWQFRLGAGAVAASLLARDAARAGGPDLIVSNGFLGVGYGSTTPRIHVYHGTIVGATRAAGGDLPRRERLRRTVGTGLAEALSARGAAAVVCVSQSAAAEARRFYRVRGETVIVNGIDTAVFSPTPRAQARAGLGLEPDGRYALFVGRTEAGKGGRLLAQACAQAGYRLLVAGRVAEPPALHLGILPPQRLALAYAAADCVLFPSLYEACSYVVLEALACGTPLLSTRVGWMPTLLQAVPEYEALCVQPTLEDVAARLRALPAIDTAALGEAAREFVREHNSLERWAASWRALLGRVVAPG